MASKNNKLPTIIEDHPLPTWSFDKDSFKLIHANKAAIGLFGHSPSEWKGRAVKDFLKVDEADKKRKQFIAEPLTADGKKIPVKGYFQTINDGGDEYNLLILHEQPLIQKDDLQLKSSRLDKIVLVSHNEIYLVNDKTLGFEYANTSALKNLGYTAEELNSLKLTDLFSFPDEMGIQALLNSLRRSATDRLRLQLKFLRKNATHYDAEVLIQVLEKNHSFLIIVNDNTDKLVTEKKLLHTILEKETLIKEIHHRVKNNLQLISSIIYLKLVSVEEPDIKNFLEDTRQKIRSISLIHERLLQTEKLDRVELSDYLGKLINDLQTTYYREGLDLKINTSIENKLMSLDTAIICGLIVNELVTNAIKHAFSGRSEGLIEINFEEISGKKFLLSVSDDGISLSDDIIPGKTKSFGMQLIDVFVKQLGGTVKINREKGTNFQIQF